MRRSHDFVACGLAAFVALGPGCSPDEPPQDEPKSKPPASDSEQEQKPSEPDQPKEDPAAKARQEYEAYLMKLIDEVIADSQVKLVKAEAPKPQSKMAAAPVESGPTPQADKPKSYKELIVGAWQMTQGGQTVSMQFKSDGTIEFGGEAMAAANIEASYSWDSDDTFTMSMSMSGPDGQSFDQKISVTVKSMDDSSMTLVYKQGNNEQEQTFTRAGG